MPEKPGPNYNIDTDPETGEIYRTDKEKRFRLAPGLLERHLMKTKKAVLKATSIAWRSNLEDEEMPEFLERMGLQAKEEYTVEELKEGSKNFKS